MRLLLFLSCASLLSAQSYTISTYAGPTAVYSDAVIYRRRNPLGAAEITLGGLHGNMPKKKLNLLQFTACGAAKPSAASTEIVRG